MDTSQLNPGQQRNPCTAVVQLTNKIGLHARPAIQLTKLAKRFASRIQIRTAVDSPWIDAKSIVQVMAAKAPRGTRLEITADGDDAREAVQSLTGLIQDNFGEKEADPAERPIATGHVASRGMAIGEAVFFQKRVYGEREGGAPEAEARLLHDSIQAVQSALDALIEKADKDIAEVLEVQAAFIQDRKLIDAVFTGISKGSSAQSAWVRALDDQIRQYDKSDDPYFQARSSDLADIKQQVLDHLYGSAGHMSRLSRDAIIIADDLAPSDFAMLDQRYCKGIALKKGSQNSHVALLSRSRGIPMLVGLQTAEAAAGATTILDAVEGRLICSPSQKTIADFRQCMENEARQIKAQQKYLAVKPVLPTGERIHVGINIASLDDLAQTSCDHCDGIGLVRTEFLFDDVSNMPGEERQFQVYKKLVQWAGNKPVIIRTLDAGGDKPLEGLTEKNEKNPFLGVRGIRLSLRNEDFFRIQLRALVRASIFGNLKIMLPMVTVPQELERAKELLEEAMQPLRTRDPHLKKPPLGIMVEIPATAMCIEDFDADFFSIGSNDLIQYVTACDRGESRIAHLYRGANRAVFGLIKATIDHGRSAGKQVSLCGDMAGQPDYIDVLIDLGLRYFSVSPAELARVKAALCARNENKSEKS